MRIKFKLPERNTDYVSRFYLSQHIIRKYIKTYLNARTYRHIILSKMPSRISRVSAFKRKDIKVKDLYPPEFFYMPQYLDVNGEAHKGFNSYKTEIPKMYILKINKGKTIIGSEEVFTQDNKVIKEIISPFKRHLKLGLKIKDCKLNTPTIINGSVACIALNGVENNYYHFWVECLARYHLLRKSGFKPDYYIFPTKTKFHNELIDLLQISPDQIIRVNQGNVICADTLIVPCDISNCKKIQTKKFGMVHSVYAKQWLPSWINEVYKDY